MVVLLWGGGLWPSLAFKDAAEVASANGLLGFCRAQLGWVQAGERHSDFFVTRGPPPLLAHMKA